MKALFINYTSRIYLDKTHAVIRFKEHSLNSQQTKDISFENETFFFLFETIILESRIILNNW